MMAATFAPEPAGRSGIIQGELLQSIARGIGNHPAVQSVTINGAQGKLWAHWRSASAASINGKVLSVSRELSRSTGDGQQQQIWGIC
jgi:hypothetical protein